MTHVTKCLKMVWKILEWNERRRKKLERYSAWQKAKRVKIDNSGLLQVLKKQPSTALGSQQRGP